MNKDQFNENQFEQALDQVVRHRFSRRRFPRRRVWALPPWRPRAWGGSSALAGSAAAGSSPSENPLSYPKNNETLLYGMQTTIPGLDPHKWWNGAVSRRTQNIFETLITLDPYTLNYKPGLSAMPVITNGGTRETFDLRKGVKFHNGQLLSSQDVKYSFERMLNPKFAAQAGSLYYLLPIKGLADPLNDKSQSISGITTPDSSTVVFDLEYPESTMLGMISYLASSIVPKAAVEQMGFNKLNLQSYRHRSLQGSGDQPDRTHQAGTERVLFGSRGCRGLRPSTGRWGSHPAFRSFVSKPARKTSCTSSQTRAFSQALWPIHA